jgi:regulator of protease activity HflC (stomatin/prohibitin superfamily)
MIRILREYERGVIFRLGKFLEARAKGRTSEAIKKLMSLRARTAHVLWAGQELEMRGNFPFHFPMYSRMA